MCYLEDEGAPLQQVPSVATALTFFPFLRTIIFFFILSLQGSKVE
jgi:hypothetical protein